MKGNRRVSWLPCSMFPVQLCLLLVDDEVLGAMLCMFEVSGEDITLYWVLKFR